MRIVLLLLVLALLTPCVQLRVHAQEPPGDAGSTSETKPATPELKQAVVLDEYLIRLGDTLEVIVERRPELNWRGQVNSEGTISSLPFINKAIPVLCQTESKIAEQVKTAYADLIRNPNITVRVIERSREPAMLLGAIRTPQRFQIQRDVRLIELLFIAGGVTDRASGDIQVFTPVPSSCTEPPPENEKDTKTPDTPLRVIKILDLMSGQSAANPIIRAGDIVTVTAAEPVYVTGGVMSPQGINYRDQLTLSRAIATVGGLTSNARGSDIRIYRRSDSVTDQAVIKADYNAIRKEKQPDIPLKAFDIIEVPQGAGGSDRRNWQAAAQDIITEGSKSGALPIRVLN